MVHLADANDFANDEAALEVMHDQAAAVCDDIADLLEVAMQRANARLETERTILQKVERK